jgi:hypothetical protein
MLFSFKAQAEEFWEVLTSKQHDKIVQAAGNNLKMLFFY